MNLGMETETIEYKKSTGEMREGMESIASILNKHGHGTLYFGVRNDGEVIGQEASEKTLRAVSQAVGNHIEPKIHPRIEKLMTEDGKPYIKVQFSGSRQPYSCDGRYRIRSADEDSPMSSAELRQMMIDSAAAEYPWDSWSSGKTIKDVDEETLRKYVQRGVKVRRIPFEYTDAQDVLTRLGLLCEDGTLTNAAMVCFTDRPEIGLRMGVLADSRRVNILDNQQVDGSLFSMVDRGEYYIVNNIRRAFIIDGSSLHRKEVPEIPISAIREALFNAFCHRDYLDLGAVQVDIFWDSVDIYSPGTFANNASPEDYLSGKAKESRPRNPLIARTLYRSGDIEAYGTGLQRIKQACDAQGTPVSVFERGRCVHIRFTRQEALNDERRFGPFGAPMDASASPVQTSASAQNTSASPVQTSASAQNTSASPVQTSASVAYDSKPHKEQSGYGDDAHKQEANNLYDILRSNEFAAYEYIKGEGEASSAQIAKNLGLTTRATRNILHKLMEKGLVEAEGYGSTRRYAITK